MKNRNTFYTKQRSAPTHMASLFYCGIICSFMLMATTHADWRDYLPSLPSLPSWHSQQKPPEQPIPPQVAPPLPQSDAEQRLKNLKIYLQTHLPKMRSKIVPTQRLLEMPSSSLTRELLMTQIAKLLPLSTAPAPPGLLLEPMQYGPSNIPSTPVGYYCSQLRAITINVLQFMLTTMPIDDTKDQIFNRIKGNLLAFAHNLEALEQKKLERNFVKIVLNDKQWSNIPPDQEISAYLEGKKNQPFFFAEPNLPITHLRKEAEIINKQHSFLVPAKRNAREVFNAFMNLPKGPGFLQYQTEYLMYYCTVPADDPRCKQPSSPRPQLIEMKPITATIQHYFNALNAQKASINKSLEAQINAPDKTAALQLLLYLLNLYEKPSNMPAVNHYLSQTLSTLAGKDASLYTPLNNALTLIKSSIATPLIQALQQQIIPPFNRLSAQELQGMSDDLTNNFMPAIQNAAVTVKKATPSFFQSNPTIVAIQSLLLQYVSTLEYCVRTIKTIIDNRKDTLLKG